MHRIPLQGGLFSSRAKQKTAVWGLVTAATLAVGSLTSMAATVEYDFETDPTSTLLINTASVNLNDAPWVTSGGNPGGFLALTYAQNDQQVGIIFPDLDEGKLVKAFRFEADLRVGNSSGDRPADGFSVSFARQGDPYLENPTNLGSGFAAGGPPEFGTATGIVVSFDTWAGNNELPGGDIEGLIIRVDNVTIEGGKIALPTRHGACDDATSLQTGPRDAAFWADPNTVADPNAASRTPESWDTLCWQPFVIDLDETGKLTVEWKGQTIVSNYQTTYFPSVSQLVLAGRTGGANEHTHFDNIKLTTILADNPLVGQPQGDSCGFIVQIADAQDVSPVESSITTTLNGAPITPSISREAPNTTLEFTPPAPLLPGTTNTVVVNFTTSTGVNISETRQYVVPAATVVGADDATTQFTASSSGFTYRVHQLAAGRGPGDANFIFNAENQLANGFYNYDGTLRGSLVDPTLSTGTSEVINWEQNASSLGDGLENFNEFVPVDAPKPNEGIPGVTLLTTSTDNIAAEILTFLELDAGCYTFGVSSDDGFVVNAGHSPFSPVAGSFNGGRGSTAGGTTFRVFVEEDGVYPFRIAWWEGGGGASIEFYSVVGTNKHLINDSTDPESIRAYSVGRTPGFLQSISPAVGYLGANPQQPIAITFKDDLTTLNEASVVVTLDGQTVTPVKTDSGALTTYTYTPSSPLAFGSTHSGTVAYSFGSGTTVTQAFNFQIRARAGIDVAGTGGFFVEAEDFDFDGGQSLPSSSVMPYTGGEYGPLVGIHDTDYHQMEDQQDPGSFAYRTETPNVPMNQQIVGAPDLDTDRGAFVVTDNYKIGWANEGDWYNYTRTFTNGNYHVWVVQSHGDAAGSPDRQRIKMSIVDDGSETFVGSYSEPASGNWDSSTINQLMVGPVPAVVTLGGTQTIRMYQREGDFDWFVFVPTTNAVPAEQFIIEAEDFNYGGGQTVASASDMPLTDAPYASVEAAVPDIDYHVVNDTQDSLLYRQGESPNVPINENNGRDQNDRGTFTRQPNYKIGWTSGGDNPEWFNYTRTFPQGNYNVYAALSHGGGGPTAGSLQLVTSGATTTTQTTQELGTFNAPGGTGGWGNNRLVPMQANGSLASVALSGEQTVRFTMGSDADFDYLIFVPTTAGPTPTQPNITAVTRSGNDLTITWTGGGVLQASDSLGATANWQNVTGGTTSPATVQTTGTFRFFRIVSNP